MPRPPLVQTEEMIKVARTQFTSDGHTASVHAIARELGLSHSALLQRFGSKRASLVQAMKPPSDFPWPKEFLTGLPDQFEHALMHLRDTCEMMCSFFREYVPCMHVLEASGVQSHEVFHDGVPLPLRACDVIASWVERGQKKGIFGPCDPATFALTLVGAMHSRSDLNTLNTHHERAKDLLNFNDFEGVVELFAQSLYLA